MFDALMGRDDQEKREDACPPPTADQLWSAWVAGDIDLDTWAALMNILYPLSDADTERMRECEAQR